MSAIAQQDMRLGEGAARFFEQRETTLADLALAPYRQPMFAIAFDMDTTAMKRHYPGPSHENGYADIKAILGEYGFVPQQRSVYYGDENVDQVACVLAVQDLANRLSWFAESVDDIRMLQLLPNDDLKRVLPT